MSFEIKGTVHEVGDTQQVSETFKKRDLIVEYAENPSYPEYIKFDLLQDKTELLNDIKAGDEIEVAFNLRGRLWTNKEGQTSCFNSLNVWRLKKLSHTNSHQSQAPTFQPPTNNDDDDLPF